MESGLYTHRGILGGGPYFPGHHRLRKYGISSSPWASSNSKFESYDFTLPLAEESSGQEHVMVVRAYDRYFRSGKQQVPRRVCSSE